MDIKLFLLLTTYIVISQADFDFPPFPEFPKMNFPKMEFPKMEFPKMEFPKIVIPSPLEMRKIKPRPGETFHGVAVQSVSGSDVDESGKVVVKEGATVITNHNGKVNEFRYDHPDGAMATRFAIPLPEHLPKKPKEQKVTFNWPYIQIEEFQPFEDHDLDMDIDDEMLKMEMPEFKMPKFKPIKMPKFKPIKMPKPMNVDEMRNYKPGPNEKFEASSVAAYSSSSNINGVKNSEGGMTKTVNKNGLSKTDTVLFNT